MSSRRGPKQNLPLPVIDLGEALGMPRPPPGANLDYSIREFIQQRNDEAEQRRRRAQEGEGTAATNAAEPGPSNSCAGQRQGKSAAQSNDKQVARKRPAVNCGNQDEEVNRTKRLAKESDFAPIGSSGCNADSPFPLQAPGKPAAVTPFAPEANHDQVATNASTPAEASPDVASQSNAGAAILPSSNGVNRCVPLIPTPATCSSTSSSEDSPTACSAAISFPTLVNFPQYIGQRGRVNAGTRHCVMCGQKCAFVSAKKNAPEGAESVLVRKDTGVCTVCRDHVWQVVDSKLEVKRCDRCHAWYPWEIFQGTKGLVKQCPGCRAKQRQRGQQKRYGIGKQVPEQVRAIREPGDDMGTQLAVVSTQAGVGESSDEVVDETAMMAAAIQQEVENVVDAVRQEDVAALLQCHK